MIAIEKIVFLHEVPLFAQLPVQDVHLVATIAREEQHDAGDVLFREGDLGDRLFLVVDGAVEIRKAKGGRAEPLNTLREKAAFGEMSLLDEGTRSATAVCVAPSRFLVIDKDDFIQLVHYYPSIAFGIFKFLCGLVRRLE